MIKTPEACPVCGGTEFIKTSEAGEICRTCGYEIDRKTEISYKPPYRKTEENRYVSGPTLESPKKYYENLLQQVYDLVQKYGDLIGVPPQDIAMAKKICGMAIRKGRWNRNYLALTSLYIANRHNSIIEIPIKKYIETFEWVEKRRFRRTIRRLVKTLRVNLNYRLDEREIYTKFYKEYGWDDRAIQIIKELEKIVKKNGIARNKSPKTLHAAIAFIAYKIIYDDGGRGTKRHRVTLKRSAEISGVSESTIREAVREILRKTVITIYL